MFHDQLEISNKQAEAPISPEELVILHVERVKKMKKKITCITQEQGIMVGKDILERIEGMNREE